MAGRYLVLEFEDKGAAEQVVRDEMAQQYGGQVVGLFLKPREYCNCSDKARQNGKNWRKHKIFGLYICISCKKPSRHHESGVLGRLQYVFGYDISSLVKK
jgi:hypothetical protein